MTGRDEPGQRWQDMSRLDFDAVLVRRIQRGWIPDRLADFAAARAAEAEVQLPGQGELFGWDEAR